MKAMVLERNQSIQEAPLRLEELALPRPQAGEVRIKVRCCAICRTDLHVIEGELPQHRLPIIPGHQIVGTVDSLGEGVTQLTVGSRVGVAWLRKTCGVCAFCRSGRENLCSEARFTGYDADGGLAEYALVDANYAYALPESLSDQEAAPLLCAGIIGYRALMRARLPAGGRLGLFGFGSSAHIVCQIAHAMGCEVYVVTRGAKHRDLAARLGVHWVGAEASRMPVLLDSIIIFAPAGELVPTALESLEKGGTLSLAGIHMSSIPSLNYEKHLFHEKNLVSVTANTREDGKALLQLASSIPIRPSLTLYELHQANQALADLKGDRIEGTGVIQMG